MTKLQHYLIVFLVSMVPLIELRGAIPYGVMFGLPLWQTFLIAIVGNMLPVPIIFFFARRVLEWGADKPLIGKIFTFFLEKGHRGGEKLQAKAGRGLYWRCCCSWAFHCPVPAHGPARWRPACWTWISRKAWRPAWAACCWPASSWAC